MNPQENPLLTGTNGGAAETATAPAPASATPQFVFAREYGERADEVNRFYNGFMGKNRSLEAYRWEFLHVPAGPCLMWTITEVATQRVVGHHSIIPTPLVCRGADISGGRTENTIVDPAVRHRIFYVGMEKKALAEALRSLRVIYTIHSKGPGALRLRLGYKPIGRWTVYLPKVGRDYLLALFERGRKRLAPRVPDALLSLAAGLVARLHGLATGPTRSAPLDIQEISDLAEIALEYQSFWSRARREYDVTIDRSLEFLRWRIAENPHLRFQTWVLRRHGQLAAVVIAHAHALGDASALYIDDIIVGRYDDAEFEDVLACLPALDARVDTIVVMTLAVDTPLHRALRRRLPVQSRLLQYLGPRLFDEMLALDRDAVAGPGPWYVTAVFTEGMDTSR